MTSKINLSSQVIPAFAPLFTSSCPNIIVTSGRAGTKSSAGAIKACLVPLAKEGTSIILRKRHNKLRKTVYKEALRALKRLKVPQRAFRAKVSPMEITFANGCSLFFSGSDSVDDTKGIIDESNPIKLVILDELTEFFDQGEGADEIENIKATFIRGNEAGFQMLYFYNPPKNPNAPINVWCREMEKRPDFLHVHVTYQDVPEAWLGRALIESADMMRQSDEKMYRHVWLGEAVGLDEMIYYMFDPAKHVKALEPDWKPDMVIIGGDYGQMNATTFQAFGLDFQKKQLVGIGEFYHSGRDSGRQKTPQEYAGELRSMVDELYKRWPGIYCQVFLDPSAAGLSEEVRRQCPDVKVRKAKNDVALGIARTAKLLAYGAVSVAPGQIHLIEEFGLYAYDTDALERGKEVPIKENDHCMDAMRYAVMGVWKYMRQMLPHLGKDEKDDDE